MLKQNEYCIYFYLRLRMMTGIKFNRLFIIKHSLFQNPLISLIIFGIFIIVSISFMIKIVEGPIDSLSAFASTNIDYNKYQNAVWSTLVTMTSGKLYCNISVGYGDYYPFSLLGKLICFIVSLIGTMIVSLIMMSLENYLRFDLMECRAFYDITNHRIKVQMEHKTAKLMILSCMYNRFKNKYVALLKTGSQNHEQLRILRINIIKSLTAKLKIKFEFCKFIR